MKYEVPEINISKFSIENIVTASAVTLAEEAVQQAMGATPTGNTKIYKTTLDEWINQ